MQSQLEWDQKEIIKSEMKKGGERCKQVLIDFRDSTGIWKKWKFSWRNVEHSVLFHAVYNKIIK